MAVNEVWWERILYAVVWIVVFLVVPLERALPFFLLFLVHDLFLTPLIVQRKKTLLYLLLTAFVLTLFGLAVFRFGGGPDGPGRPGDGPRPEWAAPGERPPQPPRDPAVPSGRPPVKPETMRFLIGLLMVGVNLGVKYFFQSMRDTKRVQELELERRNHLLEQQRAAEGNPEDRDALFFKLDYKTVRVACDDIRYVESMSEYIKVHLVSQPVPLVILYSLKRLAERLPEGRFLRIHRSYLINLSRLAKTGKGTVILDDASELPVGDLYRPALKDYLASRL